MKGGSLVYALLSLSSLLLVFGPVFFFLASVLSPVVLDVNL